MSNIKFYIGAYREEKQTETTPTLEELLAWLDANGELFSHLPHPNPEEVMGYEE